MSSSAATADGAARTLLVIRHAEKSTPDHVVRAVDEFGRPNEHELSVLGWQRAGALAALLGNANRLHESGLRQPTHLFAARPTPQTPSVRAVRTLQPLADVLGLPISLEFCVGAEGELVDRLRTLDGCALVAWEHTAIIGIATLLLGTNAEVPVCWPEDRFDLVWAFTGKGANWRLTQIPQLLLAGDRSEVIAKD
ncbi:MAG: histidine phosphatase family protein [Variovorax sp.]|nr:histidine phosphatase family protein [Variovorax sp.]